MSLSTFVDGAVSHVTALQVVVAVLITGLIYRLATKRKLSLPPGPVGLPLVGNALDFRGSTLLKRVLEWRTKYGDVIRYKLGTVDWVVLASIEAMTEAYTERGTDFASKPHVHSLFTFSQGGSNIAFAPYSEALRYRRKIAMQAMRQYMTGTQNIDRIHGVVLEAVTNMKLQKGSFSPHPFFSYIILNLLHDICFGYTIPVHHPTYIQLLDLFDNSITQGGGFWEDIFPVISYFPTKTFKKVKRAADQVRAYVNKHLQERKNNFHEDNVDTLVDQIILAKKVVEQGEDESLKAEFTDVHVLNILRDVFFAGINSSRHTMEWIFFILAVNQDVQNKVHDEIDKVVGDSTPGRDHRPDLVYTEAVIMEVMRMFPVVPMGLPHETLRDTRVGGYDIPAKTRIFVNQYAILNDPRHWDNPKTFRPERFLEDNGTKLKARNKSWIPFSLGPRNCVGEFLARQNIFFSVVGLLQKLHFDLAPEMGQPDYNPEDRWLTFEVRPYKVMVRSRE